MELFSLARTILSLLIWENSRWLSYYSHVYDFVEIDSSFYKIPAAFMVKNWCKERKTPDPVDYHEEITP
jgi:uncharacterized protein YecE (DUF72 family)